jgi:hypothetical protein
LLIVRIILQRGEHNIDDEIIFANYDNYIFHDSRGLESGDETELEIIREFILRKSREKVLKNRLHAIWFAFLSLSVYSCKLFFRYCIPMDNDAPSQELPFFDDICPDKNGMSK